ncbi:MAG: hypothetical protein AB8G11_23415, partial [Saprospiraceae bacterium]
YYGRFVNGLENSIATISNCVFDGQNTTGSFYRKEAIAMDIDGSNTNVPKIVNNIFVNFTYSGSPAINIDDDNNNPGAVYFSNNCFYNVTDAIGTDGAVPNNNFAYFVNPQFQGGSYELMSGSPLINAGLSSYFYRNYDNTINTVGIGGLFKNSNPNLSLSITPNVGDINTVFTFNVIGSDIETPQLLYTIDFNDDDTLDTDFSTSNNLQHQFASYDSVVAYVFDENRIVHVKSPSPLDTLPTVVPQLPTLTFPQNSAVMFFSTGILFQWSQLNSSVGEFYKIRLSTDSNFTNVIREIDSLTSQQILIDSLDGYQKVYWQVRAENQIGVSAWTSTWSVLKTAVCDIQNVIYQTNNVGIDSFSVSANFQGVNSYTITDGVSILYNQDANNFDFGNYPLGEQKSIVITEGIRPVP